MSYHLIDRDPQPAGVSRMTLIPFLPDGRVVAVLAPDGRPTLPSGPVRRGEHYLLDTSLRVTLMTTGFHRDQVHPFAVSGELGSIHVYAWVEGSPDATASAAENGTTLFATDPDALAALLAGDDTLPAQVVRDAGDAFDRHRKNRTSPIATSKYSPLVQSLAGMTTPASTAEADPATGAPSRLVRRMIVDNILDGVDAPGSFLDLACGDGLVMAWVTDWASERGQHIEPYGVETQTSLVRVARQRLPHWSGQIQVGDPATYRHRDGQKFTFVHLNAHSVPQWRRADAVRNALDNLVKPGGRLLVTAYHEHSASGPTAGLLLRRLGYEPVGEAHNEAVSGVAISSAWVDNTVTAQPPKPSTAPVSPPVADSGPANGGGRGSNRWSRRVFTFAFG